MTTFADRITQAAALGVINERRTRRGLPRLTPEIATWLRTAPQQDAELMDARAALTAALTAAEQEATDDERDVLRRLRLQLDAAHVPAAPAQEENAAPAQEENAGTDHSPWPRPGERQYRIVRDVYAGYEVQVRSFWLPFWTQPKTNTHRSVEDAEK